MSPETILKIPPEMKYCFVFEAFGVVVRIESNDEVLLQNTRVSTVKAFVGQLRFLDVCKAEVDYSFGLVSTATDICEIYENGRYRSDAENVWVLQRFFISLLRVTVAERARNKVFVHSGVVGIKGNALLIPGNSFTGKTTLVAELLDRGVDYLSDEYAVLDECGLVHPFTRDLSIRVDGDRTIESEIPASSFGARLAVSPLQVGVVLFTEFIKGSEFAPERLTVGNGIKEMIPHTIPIRINTEFTLKVLNISLERAIILKGPRGEASTCADRLLALFDTDIPWSGTTAT